MFHSLIDMFKPYEVEAYEHGQPFPFGAHKCWTRASAMEWVRMYPHWCDVVVWRAASFNRFPLIEGYRTQEV